MNIKIISKNYGNQEIDTDIYKPTLAAPESPVFKIIEHIFNTWYDHNTQPGAPMGKDIKGMYYGEGDQPPIYTRKGAIRQGIEAMIQEAQDNNRTLLNTRDILKMDIESQFE